MKVIEFKIYPTPKQAETLGEWLNVCCWTYNRALEHRIKAYKRRGERVGLYSQQTLLSNWRSRIPRVRSTPSVFARDAIRRVDLGFAAFFRRLKSGGKAGFPRFRSRFRYSSLAALEPRSYADGKKVRVPLLGHIRSRGPEMPAGKQLCLRLVRRVSGWFAQVTVDDGSLPPPKRSVINSVGVDVGLDAFATLSTGERIENPRWLRRSTRKLRNAQRRVSRRRFGSRNRRKAVRRLCSVHERLASQRRNFCHVHSTALVRRFDLIAIEDLNIRGMVRSRFGKSILDAAWGMFFNQLSRKAEEAGATLLKVCSRGTSQECPGCGASRPKELSERMHECQTCGLRCDRDHAAARVILSRAEGNRRETPVEGATSVPPNRSVEQVVPMKQEDPEAGHYPGREDVTHG